MVSSLGFSLQDAKRLTKMLMFLAGSSQYSLDSTALRCCIPKSC